MSFKTTDALMQHLQIHGISISGEIEKQQLINTGYFHGYKGYRFFRSASTRLPFTSYREIYATIQYDSALKALFYSKIMFIETAVKNIALESILVNANSENINTICEKVVNGFRNAPANASPEQRKKFQQKKLNLQNSIQANLARAYGNDNPKITHFYNNAKYSDVPIWALFEIMTMGDFGYLLSCLTYDVRDDISKRIGLNLSCDTDRQLIYKYIYALKDLRNAIAHNSVVFDTRFRKMDPNRAMTQCLRFEFGLPFINFKSIGDYVILTCYYLKMLKVPNTEIQTFIQDFEKITNDYQSMVNRNVAALVIHKDLFSRMQLIKKYF